MQHYTCQASIITLYTVTLHFDPEEPIRVEIRSGRCLRNPLACLGVLFTGRSTAP